MIGWESKTLQEIKGKVSIVIPVYNAENYIADTIRSVEQQTYPHWEIILINDGSTDNTANTIKRFINFRVQVTEQKNAGVSVARNKGLERASGEYIVFLDADDLLSPEFMSVRVRALDQDPELGFVGGIIEAFPGQRRPTKAAAKNPEKEILFFDPGYSTVPSNYMVRKSILYQHNLCFNTNLSSTADRFFILQLSKFTKGLCQETDSGKLLYRITEESMSHKVGPALLADNEKFYYEIVKENLLPVKKRQSFKSLYFFSLALGFAKVRKMETGLKYFSKSFLASPKKFFSLLSKKIVHIPKR